MTSANEQQHEQGVAGEPTEVAETLHGKQARAEEYDQPTGGDTVNLTGDTIVAKREPVDGDTDNQ